MLLARQYCWRQTTSPWYPSSAKPTLIACHRVSSVSGPASCALTIPPAMSPVSICTQQTPFPMPQLSPQMSLTPGKLHRQSRLCMPLPLTYHQILTGCMHGYRTTQQKDCIYYQLISFYKKGWPNKGQLTGDLLQYWFVRGNSPSMMMYSSEFIILRCRVESWQQETLNKSHSGHQGILRCCLHVST